MPYSLLKLRPAKQKQQISVLAASQSMRFLPTASIHVLNKGEWSTFCLCNEKRRKWRELQKKKQKAPRATPKEAQIKMWEEPILGGKNFSKGFDHDILNLKCA